MPTTANLQRLSALRGSLMRLSAVRRGELIRAEDWNTIVTALLELAQSVLGEDGADVAPPHEHKEQVALGWLDPGLRSTLEKGPLGDPVAAERVLKLERQMAELARRLNAVDDGVGGVRNRLAEVVTRDLVRENDVTTVRHKLEGVTDTREDVLNLRRSLDTVSVQVRAANDAAARLTVNGQPADLDGLAQRLVAVEGLRDGLRQSNGELLSAAAVEGRFTQLTNTLVTEGELSEALSTSRSVLNDEQLASIRGGLAAAVSQEISQSVGRAQNELSASISAKLSDVDAAAARAVSDALPALAQSAQSAATAGVTSAIAKSQADTSALLDKRLAENEAATGKLLDARIGDVQSSVRSTVQQELSLQLPSQFGTLGGQLDQLAKALALQSLRLESTESALKATQIRIEDFALTTTKLFEEQATTLKAEMAQRDEAQGKLFTQQLKASEVASQAATKAALDSSRAEILNSVSAKTAASTGATVSATSGAGGLAAGGGAVSGPFLGGAGGFGGLAGGGLIRQ